LKTVIRVFIRQSITLCSKISKFQDRKPRCLGPSL